VSPRESREFPRRPQVPRLVIRITLVPDVFRPGSVREIGRPALQPGFPKEDVKDD
jgi:hypothetical protein